MKGQKVLAIAAGTGRVGYVFFAGRQLRYWHLSYAASYSPADAGRCARIWIKQMQPDMVITEKSGAGCRKGAQAIANIAAIARMAEAEGVRCVAVKRSRRFPNKYAEAEALAERFPELRRWTPKPRQLWDPEPKNITIFEAIALCLMVIDPDPSG